jgi:hypothetical protein
MFAAREAYVQCQVPLLPVAAHDPAYHASPLLDPVMLSYPHPHADARLLRSHDARHLRSYAPHRNLLRLWDEFFVSGHPCVLAGARIDELLKHGSIVFGFRAKAAVAQQRAHFF